MPSRKRLTYENVVGPDLTIQGRVLGGVKELQIDGRFDGELNIEGRAVVGTTGRVFAAVNVGSLVVEGELRGSVRAHESVTVGAHGRIYGDVISPRIHVEKGGSILGDIKGNTQFTKDDVQLAHASSQPEISKRPSQVRMTIPVLGRQRTQRRRSRLDSEPSFE